MQYYLQYFLIFFLAHVPGIQLSTVTPNPSDPALPWASPSCLAPTPSRPGGARVPSSGSLTVSITLLRRNGAFMQIISDQAGVMKFGFFVSATARQHLWQEIK
ncbi:Hypothetical_protein [Hexamita inflata]|uniref:Hypothetical_protein n=1 Tax=Hexamita inflata TaxID=28002 RepID=A0AA86V652_9EUKA|nr:Hypothetical protein HINF_LOCUS65447 [Hexamita inflata]